MVRPTNNECQQKLERNECQQKLERNECQQKLERLAAQEAWLLSLATQEAKLRDTQIGIWRNAVLSICGGEVPFVNRWTERELSWIETVFEAIHAGSNCKAALEEFVAAEQRMLVESWSLPVANSRLTFIRAGIARIFCCAAAIQPPSSTSGWGASLSGW
jgi:hypothetical protein